MNDKQFKEDPFDPPELDPVQQIRVPPVSKPAAQARDWDPVLAVKALFSEQARDELLGTGPVEKIYSVPRRFDLATLFVVSTAFAFFCALLAYINFSWLAKLSCCLGISIIGTSQAVLYGGRAPRLSSVLSGALVMICLAILFASYDRDFGGEIFFFALIFGPFVGYLIGAVVGGVFLVAEHIRQNWPTSVRI